MALSLATVQHVPRLTCPSVAAVMGSSGSLQCPTPAVPSLSASLPQDFLLNCRILSNLNSRWLGCLGGISASRSTPQIMGDGSPQMNAPDSYAWEGLLRCILSPKSPQWDNQLSNRAFIVFSAFLVTVFLPFTPASWESLPKWAAFKPHFQALPSEEYKLREARKMNRMQCWPGWHVYTPAFIWPGSSGAFLASLQTFNWWLKEIVGKVKNILMLQMFPYIRWHLLT